ncbi:MAG: SusD/RagB family nutrient-binding outer membrane lipoprotein [Bacteroidetes bacterium]|nr:MAG: SusD/RagB family nutrient-binding outer membrane lipoprotein [Bacteroidota bacterium]
MKTTISNILCICFSAIIFSSCSKMVEGINDNPNNPTDADASTMLTSVLIGNVSIQEGEMARIAGMWSGYFRGFTQQYQSYHQYQVVARNYDAAWQNIYSGVYKNIKILKQKATDINNRRMLGVAQVAEANLMGTVTALWGDIPYSQAADEQNTRPAFDGQQAVYAYIQTLLDSAIVNLNSTSFVSFAAQDIHFAGNMMRWIQTANTLKARYFLQVRNYGAALAAAQNGINAQANNFMAPHFATNRGAFNLYFQFLSLDRPNWMDATGMYGINLVNPAGNRSRGNTKTNERARWSFFFNSATNLNFTVNGFFGQSTFFPLATFSENLLILAEADARINGFAAGLTRLNTYRAYMNTGAYINTLYLTAGNFRYDPYVAGDFDAGGMENLGTAPLSNVRALLREIIEERYVNFIGQIEGFNDLRRVFKEPDIRVPVPLNFGAQFPQRFLYPQVEIDVNPSTPNPTPILFDPTPVNR